VTLVYYGQCICSSSEDREEVFKIMQSLEIPSESIQFRKVDADKSDHPQARYLGNENKAEFKFENDNMTCETNEDDTTSKFAINENTFHNYF